MPPAITLPPTPPVTVTVAVAEPTLPAASWKRNVTDVVPTGKNVVSIASTTATLTVACGVNRAGEGSRSSTADPPPRNVRSAIEAVPRAPPGSVAAIVMLAGAVTTGGVVSRAASVGVSVTTTVSVTPIIADGKSASVSSTVTVSETPIIAEGSMPTVSVTTTTSVTSMTAADKLTSGGDADGIVATVRIRFGTRDAERRCQRAGGLRSDGDFNGTRCAAGQRSEVARHGAWTADGWCSTRTAAGADRTLEGGAGGDDVRHRHACRVGGTVVRDSNVVAEARAGIHWIRRTGCRNRHIRTAGINRARREAEAANAVVVAVDDDDPDLIVDEDEGRAAEERLRRERVAVEVGELAYRGRVVVPADSGDDLVAGSGHDAVGTRRDAPNAAVIGKEHGPVLGNRQSAHPGQVHARIGNGKPVAIERCETARVAAANDADDLVCVTVDERVSAPVDTRSRCIPPGDEQLTLRVECEARRHPDRRESGRAVHRRVERAITDDGVDDVRQCVDAPDACIALSARKRWPAASNAI